MKERFLWLVEWLQSIGITNALCDAKSIEERKAAWNSFMQQNTIFIMEVRAWASKFEMYRHPTIFKKGEPIHNPLVIAIIIYIFNDYMITEKELFECVSDFRNEISKIDNDYAKELEQAMRQKFLCELKTITEPLL